MYDGNARKTVLMKYKLFSFDVDGTLYSYHESNWGVSDLCVSALKMLKEKGSILVLNSGRTLNDIPKKIDGLFDYYVVCNGSALANHKKEVLYEEDIMSSEVERMIAYCKQQKMNIGLKSASKFYYYNFENCIPEYMLRNNETNPCFDNFNAHLSEKIVSISMDMKEVERKKWEVMYPNFEFSHGGFDYYEIYPKTINKLKGLNTILEIEKIPLEQCVAFGDSMNDIHILKEVGLPVVMEDGHPHVLQRFETKCLAAHEEGIYEFLKERNFVD